MKKTNCKSVSQIEIDNAIIQGKTYPDLFARDCFFVDDNGQVGSWGDYRLERCLTLRIPSLQFRLKRCEIRSNEFEFITLVEIISPDQSTHDILFSDENCDQIIAESERYLCRPVEINFHVNTDLADREFYKSPAWLRVRYQVLARYGFVCMACKRHKDVTGPLHVDHIKPRSKYPKLALDPTNLQVLCMACNLGKSNRYEHDHRGTT